MSFFLSLGVFSWNFGGVLVGRDLKCACFRPQAVLWKPPAACRPVGVREQRCDQQWSQQYADGSCQDQQHNHEEERGATGDWCGAGAGTWQRKWNELNAVGNQMRQCSDCGDQGHFDREYSHKGEEKGQLQDSGVSSQVGLQKSVASPWETQKTQGSCFVCGGPHCAANCSKVGGKGKRNAKPSVRALEDSAWRDAWTQSQWLGWEDTAGPDPEQAQTLSGGMFCVWAVKTARRGSDRCTPSPDNRKRKSHGSGVSKNRFTPLVKEQDDGAEDEEKTSALENEDDIDCQMLVQLDPHVPARRVPQRWQKLDGPTRAFKQKKRNMQSQRRETGQERESVRRDSRGSIQAVLRTLAEDVPDRWASRHQRNADGGLMGGDRSSRGQRSHRDW